MKTLKKKKKKLKCCLACNESKTPEWRSGPSGKGTLCNGTFFF